jgi:hypothetical protein
MRIHLPGKHALEFELLYILLDASHVPLYFGGSGLVILFHRHGQDFTGVRETAGDSIQRIDDVLEL